MKLREFVEREVWERFGIPFNAGAASIRYEHSMGQSVALPSTMLRTTAGVRAGEIAH